MFRVNYLIEIQDLAHGLKACSVEHSQEIVKIDRDLILMKPILIEVIDGLPYPIRNGVMSKPKGLGDIILVDNVPCLSVARIICRFITLCSLSSAKHGRKALLMRDVSSIDSRLFLVIGMSKVKLEVLLHKPETLTLFLEY